MSITDKVKGAVKDALGFGSGGSRHSRHSGDTETFYITIERAEGLKDMDRFTKSDPYVKLWFAGKSYKTKVINNDRSPVWNETFQFQVRSGANQSIQLKLMDSDVGLDDTIGEATVGGIDLPDYSGQEKQIKVNVQRRGQITGVVYLRVKRVNPNMPMHAPPPQGHGQYQPQGHPYQQNPPQQYPPYPPQYPPHYNQGPPPSNYPNQPYQQQPPYAPQQQQPYHGDQSGGGYQQPRQQNYPYQQSNQYRY